MNDIIKPRTPNLKRPARGFTLIEILVVIGIIVVLLGILIPVVSKVRKSAQVAAVTAQLKDIEGSIQQYLQDQGALPGPLPYNEIRMQGSTLGFDSAAASTGGFATTFTAEKDKISMSENLVLGLAGGLKYVPNQAPNPISFDPNLVGGGAMSLNPASPKKGRSYIDQKNLSWRTVGNAKTGKYEDGAGVADDTMIPEILDTFPNPMPILYLRARKGQQPPKDASGNPIDVTTWDADTNFIITVSPTEPGTRVGQYDLSQIQAYVGTAALPVTIGEGKSIDVNEYTGPKPPAGQLRHGLMTVEPAAKMDKAAAAYVYPYDAYPYFLDPASVDTDPATVDRNPQPRAKDGYILISAGLDRVYGTADDITSFGSVTQQ
jgi:prepilin-type N-terminal cleavage/methylation domain-containing protein